MAYKLKYRISGIMRDGIEYRLLIYQNGYTLSSVREMGDVQGLSLELQAGDAIDAPINKTTLRLTLADSRDKTSTSITKYGAWEEFFTPDALKYRVVLQRDEDGEGLRDIWAGFITPDSWSDSLNYRGSVTIVARDMIGHMADFEYKESDIVTARGSSAVSGGMVSLENLVRTAWSVAGCPMTLDFLKGEQVPHLVAGGYTPKQLMFDVTAFEGMDWYEVVEKTLASLGLCLRYCDSAAVRVLPIRALHLCGYTTKSGQPARTAQWLMRSGVRTLEPAYKQIQEKLSYDPVDAVEHRWGLVEDFDDWEAEGFEQYFVSGYYQPACRVVSPSRWSQYDSTKEVLRPTTKFLMAAADAGLGPEQCVLLASVPHQIGSSARFNYVDASNYVSYTKRVATGLGMGVSFSLAHTYNDYGSERSFQRAPSGTFYYALLWKRDSDNTYYSLLDGVWEQGDARASIAIEADENYSFGVYTGFAKGESVDLSLDFVTPEWPGQLELRIYPFVHTIKDQTNYWSQVGYHIRLGALMQSLHTESVPKTFKINTIYDESQNVTLKRNVDFGVVPGKFGTAGAIKNGIYLPDTGFSAFTDAHWSNESAEMPLPVLNHLQILSLHAKTNQLLGGTLHDAQGRPFRFDAVWSYDSRTFILQSGIWDIFGSTVQSAQLREYDTYEDAIGSASADYSANLSGGDTRLAQLQNSINAVAGAAGGGSSPAPTPGGGTVTSVGLNASGEFTVTGSPVTSTGTMTLTLKADRKILTTTEYNYLIANAHAHSNLSVLNGVTSTKVGHWNAAYSATQNGVVTSLAGLQGSISIAQLQALVDAGTALQAPRLRVIYANNQNIEEPVIRIDHPALGTVQGAEAVLMVKSGRNHASYPLAQQGRYARYRRNSWAVARSRDGSRTCKTTEQAMTLASVLDYIAKYYTRIGSRTHTQMESTSYGAWHNPASGTWQKLSGDHVFGWPDVNTATKLRTVKTFGIAVRIPNPDFEHYATGTVSEHTQCLKVTAGETTRIVPRYIYTDVARMAVQITQARSDQYVLGLGVR